MTIFSCVSSSMKHKFTNKQTKSQTNKLTLSYIGFLWPPCTPKMPPDPQRPLNGLLGAHLDHQRTMGLWNHGTLGPWDFGTMGLWDHGTLGPWDFGTMGLWDHGTLGPWDFGTMGLLNHGTLGPWDFGTMGLWDHGT
jgi:hypothetical protein